MAPGNTAKLFNSIAETLHQVAVLVPVMIRLWLLVAITALRLLRAGMTTMAPMPWIIWMKSLASSALSAITISGSKPWIKAGAWIGILTGGQMERNGLPKASTAE